jgi:hypothetical protein
MSKTYEFATINRDYGIENARFYINPNDEPVGINPDTLDWVQIKPITRTLVVRKVMK